MWCQVSGVGFRVSRLIQVSGERFRVSRLIRGRMLFGCRAWGLELKLEGLEPFGYGYTSAGAHFGPKGMGLPFVIGLLTSHGG